MNARLRVASVSSVLLLIAIPTVGQTTSAPAARTEGGCPLANRTTAGAPYSGLQENTHSQTLTDGTHIESKEQTYQFYRDSQGRQRTEMKGHFFGPTGEQVEFLRNIVIIDPVACIEYNLLVSEHVALRHTYALNEMTPAGQSNAVKQAAPATREELRHETSTERLGTDTIEGVAVEGKRITTTYPVGSLGNDRPFVVTHEVWRMSLEPKLIVLSKTSDPRSGETTEHLTNIKPWEPSPTLFRVPADYQIQDPPYK
jgi:hypothetical protein